MDEQTDETPPSDVPVYEAAVAQFYEKLNSLAHSLVLECRDQGDALSACAACMIADAAEEAIAQFREDNPRFDA